MGIRNAYQLLDSGKQGEVFRIDPEGCSTYGIRTVMEQPSLEEVIGRKENAPNPEPARVFRHFPVMSHLPPPHRFRAGFFSHDVSQPPVLIIFIL